MMRKISFGARLFRTLPDRRAARLLSRRRLFTMVRDVATPTRESPSTASSIEQLERVLERHSALALITSDTLAAKELRAAICAIAIAARAEDPVRCERMLLELRCAWRDFPEVRRLADQPLRDALWNRIVRLSCEEFYGRRARLAVVA